MGRKPCIERHHASTMTRVKAQDCIVLLINKRRGQPLSKLVTVVREGHSNLSELEASTPIFFSGALAEMIKLCNPGVPPSPSSGVRMQPFGSLFLGLAVEATCEFLIADLVADMRSSS
jgi:hypothetical protein